MNNISKPNRKMTKACFNLCVALTLGLLSFATQAQRPNDEQLINSYAPPSPEASSLGKYADYPISYFTGSPNINIPLFEVGSGRIKLPISLSYHSGGIKLDEIASRVGMGWSLNAGGVIAKTIVRYPDDMNTSINCGGGNCDVLGYWNLPSSYDLGNSSAQQDIYDSEPDIYFYNFNGHTGKFYFTSPTEYLITNSANFVISAPYINGGNGYLGYDITTDDGLIYRFHNVEQTHLSGTCANNIIITHSSGFFLTEIEDPLTGKTVTFTYEDAPGNLSIFQHDSYTYNSSCFSSSTNYSCSNTKHIYNAQILTRIDFDDGYVTLDRATREDLTNDKHYTAIKLYNKANQLIKGYSFDTDYEHISGNTTELAKRLFLNGISEIASDGSSEERYAFDYKTPHLLPPRDSFEQDAWGYFNDNNATDFKPTIYDDVSAGKKRYAFYNNGGTLAVSGADRTCNTNTIDIGTISKITYPTGGYSTFDFDPDFTGLTGGGLRIAEKVDRDSDGSVLSTTKYTYSIGKRPGAVPQLATTRSGGIMRFYHNRSHLGTNAGGYVGYTQVTETKYYSTGTSGPGIIFYEYLNESDVEPTLSGSDCESMSTYSYFPFFKWDSREAKRGLLDKVSYYQDASNQNDPPTRVIDYTYEHIIDKDKTIKMGSASNSGSGSGSFSLTAERKIRQEVMLLTAEVETINNPDLHRVVTSTYYDYYKSEPNVIDYNVLKSKSVQVDEGQSIKTEYKYPFNFGSTASGGVMEDMVDLNYISPVIHEQVWSTGSGSASLLSARINDFRLSGGKVVPDQIYILETADPIPSASVTALTDPSNPSSSYKVHASFDQFDASGHVLEISDLSEVPTAYIWTDYVQYPVVSASNVSNTTLQSAVTSALAAMTGSYADLEALLTVVSDMSSQSDRDIWQEFNDLLRANVGLDDAMVTTYTIDPLIGVTSQTDPNGLSSYYDYDDYGRLRYARDNDGNIISRNEYNLKSPSN